MDGKERVELATRLGGRIAQIRIEAGMTQAFLAERLGIGVEHVSRFERGAVLPTLPRLFDIADVFERGVDELLVTASSRTDDQVIAMARRISQLSGVDRAFVTEMVERLTSHLLVGHKGK